METAALVWRPPQLVCEGAELDQSRNTEVTDLYKSGGTYDNSLRLVRQAGPCSDMLASIRRTHPSELVFGRSPGICGNFLRLAPLTYPCFRRHAATPRIARPLGRGHRLFERLPVQSEQIGKRRRSELP
jgi:hypothetical protein